MRHLLRIIILTYSISSAQIIYDSPPVGISLTRPALPWLARYFVGATNPVHHFLDEPQRGPLGGGFSGGAPGGIGGPSGGGGGSPFGDGGAPGSGGGLQNNNGGPGGAGPPGRNGGPDEGSIGPGSPGAGFGDGGFGDGNSQFLFDASMGAPGGRANNGPPSVPVPVPVLSAPSLPPRTFLPPVPPMPAPIPVVPAPPPQPYSPPLALNYPPMPSPVALVPQMPIFEQPAPLLVPASVPKPMSFLPPVQSAVPAIPPAIAPAYSDAFVPPAPSLFSAGFQLDAPRVLMRPGELAAPNKSLFYRNVIVGSGDSSSITPQRHFSALRY